MNPDAVPTVLLVLGMHRSGTSAVTRLVNLLGAELGEPLLAAQADINDAGFWEHAEVVDLNERILAALDSRWFDHRPYPDGWWLTPSFAGPTAEASELLQRHFTGHPLVAIKDPRLCRTLPLWRTALHRLDWPLKVVLVLRDPYEVAASLQRRDGLPQALGLYLWLIYSLEAERFSRGLPRTVLHYTELLSDWHKSANRIGQALQLIWPVRPEDAAPRIAHEIRAELRHQRTPCSATRADRPEIETLQTLLAAPVMDDAAIDRLRESLRQRFGECRAVHDALYAGNHALLGARREQIRIGALHATALDTLQRRDAEIGRLNGHLEELGRLYSHAESVVRERDQQLAEIQQQLRELGRLYSHAESVVRERDQQLAEVQQQLRERDARLAALETELSRITTHWSWSILRYLHRGRRDSSRNA